MICDTYREQTALYVPLLLGTAFSQFSDFNHFTPMTEEVVLTRKNILQKMKYQRNCWRTLSDVPEDADSDSKNDSDSSIVGNS